MALEDLLKIPAHEKELQDCLVSEIQAHYEYYKNKCYFLKLERIDDKTSQLIWIKEFVNEQELDDFYFDTVFERACVMFKFRKDRYEVLYLGYHRSNWFQVYESHHSNGRPQELDYNREMDKMIPEELLKGIDDLKGILASSKMPKAM